MICYAVELRYINDRYRSAVQLLTRQELAMSPGERHRVHFVERRSADMTEASQHLAKVCERPKP